MDAPTTLAAAREWLLGLPPAQQAVGLAALTLLPWIELRGSIPVAIALGWHPLTAAALAVAVNCLLVPPTYFGLEWFYARWLSRVSLVRRVVEGVRGRGGALVERYELLGLALFVAVPLPGTGAYSGTALAWLVGLPRWRAMAAVAAGVAGAGVAVTLLATGAAVALRRWF
ncbi:MAG: small multi-drug export protein [Armatimonadota bacterium]|nr:small multi-drug export protein [Armatimonadota bacterium]MDR7454485.1 small multi-drug export protein [Armatimonadota bacterium]MDR7457970.1 small multi-drug export protein [Armatimonadota bacterium]MDR7497053.1 small multi-drug export protein [Armatimonadota bacterium]